MNYLLSFLARANLVNRLFEHYLGACYRITYLDKNGETHAFRIISHDLREAALVQLIFNKLRDSNDNDLNSSIIDKQPAL